MENKINKTIALNISRVILTPIIISKTLLTHTTSNYMGKTGIIFGIIGIIGGSSLLIKTEEIFLGIILIIIGIALIFFNKG